MSESVDLDFICDNADLIVSMISEWLRVYAGKYELATVMNQELKTSIIDKSIIYASAISTGGFDVSSFDECYISEEIKEIKPLVILTEFRKMLEDQIDKTIFEDLARQEEKLFIIRPDKHLGRRDLLSKCVVYQIKFLYEKYIAEKKVIAQPGLCYGSFEKYVWSHHYSIVNRAIQFLLCHEANNKDDEMCRKILVESALNEKDFHYRLEKHVDIGLKKEIEDFLKTFESKKLDFEIFNINNIVKVLLNIVNKSKDIDEELKNILVKTVENFDEIDDADKVLFVKVIEKAEYSVIGAKESLVKKIKALNKNEFQEALLNTIDEVKKAIEIIFSSDAYEDCKQCRQIHQEHKDLIKNSKERVSNPAKLKNFKIALKKAKLNYVSKYKDRHIYPFLYDLIVLSFSFAIKKELYNSNIENTNTLEKSRIDRKYRYIDKDSNENYLLEDLSKLVEIFPNEFKNVDPALLIIKHYSEILNVEYTDIATVLRQLRFQVPDDAKSVYAFPKHLRNIKLSIDGEHFRTLSLYVI